MEILNIHKDIEDFIKKLDVITQAQILRVIDLLRLREYHLSMPYSKKIDKDIYELRIKSTKNIRILYAFNNENIILLHIIDKKKQKLLKNDIETAKNRLKWLQ